MFAAPPAAVFLFLLSLFSAAAALVFLWKGRGGVVISTCSIDSDMASLVRGEVSNAEDMKRVRLSPDDGGVILECGGDGGVCGEVEVVRAEEELLLFDDDSAAARDDSIGGGRATTSTPS